MRHPREPDPKTRCREIPDDAGHMTLQTTIADPRTDTLIYRCLSLDERTEKLSKHGIPYGDPIVQAQSVRDSADPAADGMRLNDIARKLMQHKGSGQPHPFPHWLEWTKARHAERLRKSGIQP